jgi:hypothetical protein
MAQERLKIYARLRAPKAAAIAGIIFAILLFISTGLLLTSLLDKPLDQVEWFARSSSYLLLSLNLIPFAGIAFLWFIGVVRDYLGDQEDKFFATVFLGSGLLFLTTLFIAAASMGTVILLSKTEPKNLLASGIYDLGWSFSRYMMFVYTIRMAGVFMISTSSLFFRTRVVPRWMSLLGFLLAAIMIFRISQIDRLGWVFLLFPLWILMVSIYILITYYWHRSEVLPTER